MTHPKLRRAVPLAAIALALIVAGCGLANFPIPTR
ncbi:hypothetical protein BCF33_1610 [Hasllibacter halocynthiae]|uniref:Lipoprotein n=1 Tax=Hasllibacter halocynthiae TaxID=595589 RepID=A0A2T0X1D3_9RHOB|nr:hypothetical protein BCF33_1610 [Hasllibacter halocynthiae]